MANIIRLEENMYVNLDTIEMVSTLGDGYIGIWYVSGREDNFTGDIARELMNAMQRESRKNGYFKLGREL